MDARQLRYFITVAQLGSFSAASRRLHVAQPALSRHVKALEELLGVALLERSARGVTLTSDGEELFNRGTQVLEQLDMLPRLIGPTSQTVSGRVVIGLPTSASAVMAVPLLKAALARYPQIRIHLIESLSGYLQEWIEEGRLDLAVVYNPSPHSGIRVDPILTEDLWIVGAAGSLPLEKGSITLGDLPRYPLLLPGATHSHRRLVEGIAAGYGVRLDLVAEVDSLSVQKQMVAAGSIFTILPRGAIHEQLVSGILEAVPIVEPTISRLVTLATSLSRSDNQACNVMARLVLEVGRGLVSKSIWHGRLETAA
jgi:LysR family nitrogen assimilation transcriptional regulator